jgi:hypothetical protein
MARRSFFTKSDLRHRIAAPNVQAYPSFIVLDHRGAIRFKDLFPQDERGFGEAIKPLLEQAERAATQ